MIRGGAELVATVVFEIDEPVRGKATLARLGGVEDRVFLQVGSERVASEAERDIERTRAELARDFA